jgi:hypothetical protein
VRIDGRLEPNRSANTLELSGWHGIGGEPVSRKYVWVGIRAVPVRAWEAGAAFRLLVSGCRGGPG